MIPKELSDFIKEIRNKGIEVSDNEAKKIYSICLKKICISKVVHPDKYIYLLYQDELKNYLFRRTINKISILSK